MQKSNPDVSMRPGCLGLCGGGRTCRPPRTVSRYFECEAAIDAMRPGPWHTRQVSLLASATLRCA